MTRHFTTDPTQGRDPREWKDLRDWIASGSPQLSLESSLEVEEAVALMAWLARGLADGRFAENDEEAARRAGEAFWGAWDDGVPDFCMAPGSNFPLNNCGDIAIPGIDRCKYCARIPPAEDDPRATVPRPWVGRGSASYAEPPF